MRQCYLLLFLSFSGSRTPSQRTVDSTPSTTDILTASSLHLPHIPSAANSNAFRASKKDDSSSSKSVGVNFECIFSGAHLVLIIPIFIYQDWNPPVLKPSGSFHSTKITRMDSYGATGVAKLSISASKSNDDAEGKPHPTKAPTETNTSRLGQGQGITSMSQSLHQVWKLFYLLIW